jgi:hypothetical protein
MTSRFSTIKAFSVVALLALGALPSATAQSPSVTVSQRLEQKYLATLDRWAARGLNTSTLQDSVVATCGKLVMITSSKSDAAALATTWRDEFDFRVDVCTNLTVHRVEKQPRFADPKIVNLVCVKSSVSLYRTLCKRAGLA